MDYIEITTNDGHTLKMEIVTIYKMDNNEFNYIIYKSNDNNYYVGKYLDNKEDLITNLTEEEIKYANNIMDMVKEV